MELPLLMKLTEDLTFPRGPHEAVLLKRTRRHHLDPASLLMTGGVDAGWTFLRPLVTLYSEPRSVQPRDRWGLRLREFSSRS